MPLPAFKGRGIIYKQGLSEFEPYAYFENAIVGFKVTIFINAAQSAVITRVYGKTVIESVAGSSADGNVDPVEVFSNIHIRFEKGDAQKTCIHFQIAFNQVRKLRTGIYLQALGYFSFQNKRYIYIVGSKISSCTCCEEIKLAGFQQALQDISFLRIIHTRLDGKASAEWYFTKASCEHPNLWLSSDHAIGKIKEIIQIADRIPLPGAVIQTCAYAINNLGFNF